MMNCEMDFALRVGWLKRCLVRKKKFEAIHTAAT